MKFPWMVDKAELSEPAAEPYDPVYALPPLPVNTYPCPECGMEVAFPHGPHSPLCARVVCPHCNKMSLLFRWVKRPLILERMKFQAETWRDIDTREPVGGIAAYLTPREDAE